MKNFLELNFCRISWIRFWEEVAPKKVFSAHSVLTAKIRYHPTPRWWVPLCWRARPTSASASARCTGLPRNSGTHSWARGALDRSRIRSDSATSISLAVGTILNARQTILICDFDEVHYVDSVQRMSNLDTFIRARESYIGNCCFFLLERSELYLPGGPVRGERAHFTGLVLGCIEAKVCK